MNIPALEANVEEIDRQIARLERELADMRLKRQLTVNDIAAARLQAWYAANPGIELAVGDELAVTDEYRATRLNRNKGVATIQAIYLHSYDDEPVVEIVGDDTATDENEDYWVDDVTVFLARRMREAWLAQEAQS